MHDAILFARQVRDGIVHRTNSAGWGMVFDGLVGWWTAAQLFAVRTGERCGSAHTSHRELVIVPQIVSLLAYHESQGN